MVRAKLQAFLSNKKKSKRLLPKGVFCTFLERKMKKMMAPLRGDGGCFGMEKMRALEFLKKWSL